MQHIVEQVNTIYENYEKEQHSVEETKKTVYRMTNTLQRVLGYLELADYDAALKSAIEMVEDLRVLSGHLSTISKNYEATGFEDIVKTVKIIPKNTTVEVTSGDAPRTVVTTAPETKMKVQEKSAAPAPTRGMAAGAEPKKPSKKKPQHKVH